LPWDIDKGWPLAGKIRVIMERREQASGMKSVEQMLLAYAAELNPKPYQLESLGRLLAGDADLDHLIEVAFKEGLAGLLYRNLEKSGLLERLGDKQKETLQSQYYAAAGFNLRLIHDLKAVLHLLNQKKIRVVLLQGIDLVQDTYKDIGLRPMVDIDLWVRPRDFPELIRVLKNLGYQRDRLYPGTFKKGATTFDVHTHVLWADRIRARKRLLKVGEEDIYDAARVVDVEGEEALCLSPQDQVIYLSLHVFKHYADRLIWLVDIKCLVSDWRESDWQALFSRAKAMGQEKTLSCTFFLLQNLLDFQLPDEAHKFFKGDGPDIIEKKALKGRLERGRVPVWVPVLLSSAGKGLGTRLSLLFESLFPRPEIMRQIFPSPPDLKTWQLYWKRVLQLLSRFKTPTR